MSKPGTDLLRLPIEPSDVSGSSRRSSVDTYSVIKNTDQQLSYDTNSVLVWFWKKYNITAHGYIYLNIYRQILTSRPGVSFDALLEESFNIYIWARIDRFHTCSLERQKRKVIVREEKSQ